MPLFAEDAIDIIQTVGMAVSIVVEKIVHLRTAARVQQVVLTHLVISHFKHRSVKIGIYHVAGLEFQRFVAVYGYSGGKEFIGSFSAFCKEIYYLTAFYIYHRDILAGLGIYGHAAAWSYDIFFFHLSPPLFCPPALLRPPLQLQPHGT